MAANDDLRDDAVKTALAAFRVSSATNRQAVEILADLEEKLAGMTAASAPLTETSRRRLEDLLGRVRNTIRKSVSKVAGAAANDAADLGDIVATRTIDAMNGAIGAEIAGISITRRDLLALHNSKVIQGQPLSNYWDAVSGETARNYEKAVRESILLGETNDQMVAKILGKRGTPSVVNTTKARAKALIRTSVMSVNNEVMKRTIAENVDLVKWIQHLSTLDGRTTFICIARDGLKYEITDDGIVPVGHDKAFLGGPPYHPQCRSVIIPILPSFAELSGRKINGKKFDKAFDDSLKKSRFDAVQRASIAANTRASMDGQVPRSLTFEDFASQKGGLFLDDVLGPGRAELFTSGKISFVDLIDGKGGVRTIKELKKLGRAGAAAAAIAAATTATPRPTTPRPSEAAPKEAPKLIQEKADELHALQWRIRKEGLSVRQVDDNLDRIFKGLSNDELRVLGAEMNFEFLKSDTGKHMKTTLGRASRAIVGDRARESFGQGVKIDAGFKIPPRPARTVLLPGRETEASSDHATEAREAEDRREEARAEEREADHSIRPRQSKALRGDALSSSRNVDDRDRFGARVVR